ncbi:PAS domain S-box protein [Limisphaera sp. VF-2]|mgnify:CR=1 FL=1|jgi:PAS domain S-box-containing protein|uniref:PAS domain S-box protein n=1 Tax=Limisphaera sp. VF-2 TaxID=3400418 RepID=UPI003C19508E
MSPARFETAQEPAGDGGAGPALWEGTGGPMLRAEAWMVGHALVQGDRLMEVSPALAQLLGSAVDTWRGRSAAELFPSATEWSRVSDRLAEARQAGATFARVETRLRNGTDEGRSVLLLAGWSRRPEHSDCQCWWFVDLNRVRGIQEELDRRSRQLALYHRLAEEVLAGEGVEPPFDWVTREVARLSGFPIVTLATYDADQGLMVYRGAWGLDFSGLPVPLEIPVDVDLAGRVLLAGETVVALDVGEWSAQAAPLVRQWGIQTYLGVPLRVGSHLLGVLGFADRQRRPVAEEERELAEQLGDYLAMLLDRWQAREGMRRREAELQAVYDQAPGIMCVFDPQLRMVRANRAAAEYAQRPAEELPGLQLGAFLRCEACARRGYECGTSPDCPPCELRQALVEAFREGRRWEKRQVQKTLLREGRPVEATLLVSTERIRVNGLDRVLLCLEDITERKQAEMRIRSQAALLEVTRDAVLVRDFCDRILYWNEGAAELYGWSAAEVQGRTTHELGFMTDEVQVAEAVEAVQDRGEWNGEMRHRHRSGRELAVQSRWTLIRRSDGFPRAILIVSTDITEKKQLETHLLRSQRLESIGTLASGLAHDLNNVLSPILMAVQYLKDEVRSEAARTCLQTLETCAQRGAGIIRQVLTFARGVEGTRVLLQLKHLVREVERIITETFPRSIQVQVRMTRQPWLVRGDPTQLQQVLLNLCVNARDAMPQGGTLTLRLDNQTIEADPERVHPRAKAGPYVVMSVQDTGVGIPAELLDKIFDPFFTTKPVGQGTGLGLATVLGIVEAHGGFVLVESQVGRGSTFSVHLPALPHEQGGDTSLRPKPAARRGQGQKILVADDEPAVRQITAALLRTHGYEPVLAADGQEALAILEGRRDQIHAVITDLMMPRMDGPALLRALQRVAPGLPAISITGLGEEGRVAEARAAGARVNLDKPFTAEQLLAALEQVLMPAPAAAPAAGT